MIRHQMFRKNRCICPLCNQIAIFEKISEQILFNRILPQDVHSFSKYIRFSSAFFSNFIILICFRAGYESHNFILREFNEKHQIWTESNIYHDLWNQDVCQWRKKSLVRALLVSCILYVCTYLNSKNFILYHIGSDLFSSVQYINSIDTWC